MIEEPAEIFPVNKTRLLPKLHCWVCKMKDIYKKTAASLLQFLFLIVYSKIYSSQEEKYLSSAATRNSKDSKKPF